MNLQNLKLKASTLCAGGTLLVFGGFLTVNLAGCGGGGGGGLTTIPTPAPVGATFRLVQQDSTPSKGGTLTLTGKGKTYTGTADNGGVVNLGTVAPGTYTATFTAFDASGKPLATTTRTLTITKSGAQTFVLVQGDTGNGKFTLTGTIFQNPLNNKNTSCTSSSTPIIAEVLVTVRDLNDTVGAPIIAQIVRTEQSSTVASTLKGRYTISLPTAPRSFRVEVSPSNNNGVGYAGISATTTFTQGTTTLANVDVCTNLNGVIPIPFNPTATPTVTPTGGIVIPGATFTSTPNPTSTTNPNATSTSTPGPTSTSRPTATPTQPGSTTLNSTAGNTSTGNTTINNTTLTTAGNTSSGNTSTGSTTINDTTLTTAGNTSAGNTTISNTTTTTTTTTRRRR